MGEAVVRLRHGDGDEPGRGDHEARERTYERSGWSARASGSNATRRRGAGRTYSFTAKSGCGCHRAAAYRWSGGY